MNNNFKNDYGDYFNLLVNDKNCDNWKINKTSSKLNIVIIKVEFLFLQNKNHQNQYFKSFQRVANATKFWF